MKKFLVLVLASAAFLAACEDPAANKPKATTTNSASSTATNSPANNAPANTVSEVKPSTGNGLAITPENSKVEFTGSKVTGKHDGGFKQFTGNIDLVNNKPEESKVFVEMDVDSMFTDDENLTKHLKTADFFDVAKFPKASFTSTKIVPDTAKGANNYTVSGDFDLHGVKKEITFPATITVSDADVAVKSEFSINRKDFGIVYAGKTDDLIRDDVVIKLDLKTPRKK